VLDRFFLILFFFVKKKNTSPASRDKKNRRKLRKSNVAGPVVPASNSTKVYFCGNALTVESAGSSRNK